MKVCCGSGKPYDTQTDIQKLGCYSTDHCVGPIEVEDFDLLLTGLGTFDTNDCISHEDMRHLFNKADSWEEWITSQVEQEGIEKYKAWYARMNSRCDLHPELIEAHNELFGEEG
jgi:hypothetical protein